MEITNKELKEYIDENGRSPFREWLLSLKDMHLRTRVRIRVNRLRLGNFGDCRFLGNGVYELKMDVGPGYRLYFGLHPTLSKADMQDAVAAVRKVMGRAVKSYFMA